MATLKDIAEQVGVTPAVVSRLLRGDDTLRVNPKTREKILQVAQELEYAPNISAQSLRLSRSKLIAMVVHDVVNPVFAEIVSGAQQAAKEHNYSLLLGDADPLGPGATRMTDLIRGGALDGFILQGADTASDQALRDAASKHVRTVLLQERPGSDYGVVRLPDEQAGVIATDHLLDLGHTKIGMLGTAEGLHLSEARHQGWRTALDKRGIIPDQAWVGWFGSDVTAGYEGMKQLLTQAADLTAIVVSNVATAIGGVSAAFEMGHTVPDDLSIVAIHDTPFAKHLRPALTVVDMPLATLGRRAVEMLLGDVAPAGQEVVVETPSPQLIERASTRRV